jgi:hypothetical protein
LDEFYRLTNAGGLSRRDAISSLSGRFRMASRELYKLIEEAKKEVE